MIAANRDLDLLHPEFRSRVQKGLMECHQQNLMVYIFEGWRSLFRQSELYDQGRKNPGNIVTNAKAGSSTHEWGIAVDLVFDGKSRDGIQWSWDGDYVGERVGDYERVAEIMTKHGLRQLRNGKGQLIEMPHFQINSIMTYTEMRKVVRSFGVLHLWNQINKELDLEIL